MNQKTHEPAPTGKKTVLIWTIIAILGIAIVAALVLIYAQNKTIQSLENQDSVTQMQTYSDENYSFEYPQNYKIKKEVSPERIEVVGENGKLYIFQLKSPSGERVTELGFGGTDPKNIPSKMEVVENEQTWFDVWLFYDTNDKTTEEELLAIYKSIKLKGNSSQPAALTEKQTTPEEISFDGCGKLSKYENKPWYPELAKNTTLSVEPVIVKNVKTEEYKVRDNATLKNVYDACFSENGNLLVMLIPGGYAQGPTIYRFDTKTYKLDRATLEDNERGWLASPYEFGKRTGNIIYLEGTSGDAGAGSTMYYEYDFVKNTVELKKEYNFIGDPDTTNGTWKYY